MAVNADWSKVRDHEELHKDDNQWKLTEAFMTFGYGYGLFDYIGMNSLTEANVAEAWMRLSLMQSLTPKGAFFHLWTGTESVPVPVTLDDLVRRIGLRSNYSTMTRSAWMTKKLKLVFDARVNELTESLAGE